jgi:hypothetical protein
MKSYNLYIHSIYIIRNYYLPNYSLSLYSKYDENLSLNSSLIAVIKDIVKATLVDRKHTLNLGLLINNFYIFFTI